MFKVQKVIYLPGLVLVPALLAALISCSQHDAPELDRHNVVVFPFHALEPSSGEVAVEISTKLIRSLSGITRVEIISGSELPSSQRAENHHLWAKDAHIALIVEGTVHTDQDGVGITVQIVDGQTDSHVWSQTFQARATDAKDVVRMIKDQVQILVSERVNAGAA